MYSFHVSDFSGCLHSSAHRYVCPNQYGGITVTIKAFAVVKDSLLSSFVLWDDSSSPRTFNFLVIIMIETPEMS